MEDKNIVNEQLQILCSTTNALRYNPHFEADQRNYSVLTSVATLVDTSSFMLATQMVWKSSITGDYNDLNNFKSTNIASKKQTRTTYTNINVPPRSHSQPVRTIQLKQTVMMMMKFIFLHIARIGLEQYMSNRTDGIYNVAEKRNDLVGPYGSNQSSDIITQYFHQNKVKYLREYASFINLDNSSQDSSLVDWMLTIQDEKVPYATYNVLSAGYYTHLLGNTFTLKLKPSNSIGIFGDVTYNLSFTNENNIRYVKGSWGQDGTLLGNGGLVKDTNTRCIS